MFVFYLQRLGVLHIVDENKWLILNPEEILSQKCFNAKILIWKFDLFYLTSIKSKFWWRYRVKCPSLSVSMCTMTQETCVARHVCDFYFLVTFCDLTLTFSGMTFVLTHYHYQTFTTGALCEFELIASRLTDHTVQNVKTVFFTFDLTLTLHMTFMLKC